jgi:predicted ATPase
MRLVITGGPCVGKTTLINLLQDDGYKVVQEVATEIIKEGRILPWIDRMQFQMEVLRMQLETERGLAQYPKDIFLDRGVFDGEAYFKVDGMAVPPIFNSIDPKRYELAFLIEPLSFFEITSVRRESLEFTLQITDQLEAAYARRGIEVVRVPAASPEERLNFVLKRLKAAKKSHRTPVVAPIRKISIYQAAMPLNVVS